MGDFRQGGGKRFGSRPNFFNKGRSDFDSRDRGPVTMHRTTCAKCGNPCEVPFRPVEGRPLYCKDCFQGKKADLDNRGGDRFPQKSFDRRPFTKPDFRNNEGGENNSGVKKQLEILNLKMDRLIKAVESMASIKPAAAEGEPRETVEEAAKEEIAPVVGEVSKKNKRKIFKKGKRK